MPFTLNVFRLNTGGQLCSEANGRPSRNRAVPSQQIGRLLVSVQPSHVFGRRNANSRQRRKLQCTSALWLENNAEVDVGVPLETCWSLWEDQELIPKWMPWIHSVKVFPDDKKMSRWTLRTNQFGRDWEFSWVARLLTPVRSQKIHWRSVPGSTGGSLGSGLEVANRGQIRFYPRGSDACSIKLTIAYEVPSVLAPLGGALTPVVEGILKTDMRRFAEYAAAKKA